MNTKFFPEFGNQYDFPRFENAVLEYWKKCQVFQRLLKQKAKRKRYGFYDGPPFATGTPHYGHLLAGTIKDIVPRYWSMRGFHVERRFGWDCHGLPVEFEMEKTLNLNGSLDIIDYGIAKFNEACRGIVLRYTSEWRSSVEKMGRWVDMDNDYKTMNPDFMESIWWIFSELWKKQLIYQGKKVVPYSWRITAPLSNFEASLNYRSVQDPAISVLFQSEKNSEVGYLAWTTTPWTLPANLALAINPNLNYIKVKIKTPKTIKYAWLAQDRLGDYTNELEQEPLETKLGEQLVGEHYKPLFPFYQDKKKEGAFRILAGDFVTATDGSGFVHTAPAFGEDDFFLCQKNKLPLVDPTDAQANFTNEAQPYQGKFVKDADKDIIQDLKAAGNLLKHATLQHNYPYCYRSDTPLIYKAISSWFVNVEKIKPEMIANNQTIHWTPQHIRDGRFGKWLENARDWCISRNRFWGTPIPVWICEACNHKEVIASRIELDKIAGKHVEDLHSHFVDEIKFPCPKCKSTMKRTPEVLDCWFESGSMPYAEIHYPFENKQGFEKSFPADFIAEGLDQTRGWFYTLTVLATALRNQPAFKHCIVNGMVMAEDGKKMSKRLKNYPDPNDIIHKYGADTLRLYFMQSPAVHGEELRFSEKFMVENMRAVLLPLWNAYSFFSSYANIDEFSPKDIKDTERAEIDYWILALLKQTEAKVHHYMENYELAPIASTLSTFIDNLTNWYIRLNRQRFWEAKGKTFSNDKLAAYTTLWEVLERFSFLIAPFLPFFSECLHSAIHGIAPQNLVEKNPKSVHEELFSLPKKLTDKEEKLILKMALAQKVILLGRSLRSEAKIGLRQPLDSIALAGISLEEEKIIISELKPLVLQELNIKGITILQDASNLVLESAKPNLKRLGPRLGPKLKEIQNTLKSWGAKEIQNFEAKGNATIAGETLTTEDILIDRQAKPGKCAGALQGLVAELDTKITTELQREGLAREIINRIQQRRKTMQLNLTDRIDISWAAESLCKTVLTQGSTEIQEILHAVLGNHCREVSYDNLSDKEKYEFPEDNTWFAFSITKS